MTRIRRNPMMRAMKRLLLTGFGAFPGAPQNPTETLVNALARQAPRGLDAHLFTHVLPVIWREAEVRIASLIEDIRPDTILHLGLATQRAHVSVETRARNECSITLPDAENICRRSGTIDPKGPGLRLARLDIPDIIETLRAAGLTTHLSNDAGDYVCNHTLYLSLGSAVPRVGFIHLPYPTEAMTLGMMQKGIEDILRRLA